MDKRYLITNQEFAAGSSSGTFWNIVIVPLLQSLFHYSMTLSPLEHLEHFLRESFERKIIRTTNLGVEKRFGPKSVPNVPSKEEPIDVWRRAMKQLEQRHVREMFRNVPERFHSTQLKAMTDFT